MTGLLICARYSFSPNKLKYCGPDKNQELQGYLKTKTSDEGLKNMLEDFNALHPYLKLIAKENGIRNEFDERVVEAYWLGNELLETVTLKSFFNHALKRLSKKDLRWFEIKLPQGAKPNHQFHVLNFWKRTGHLAILQTLETMDNCRISTGKIIDSATIKTNKLIYRNGRLSLEPAVKEVQSLEGGYQPGDLVTTHWNFLCEKITLQQAKNLEKYTNLALRLANLTI